MLPSAFSSGSANMIKGKTTEEIRKLFNIQNDFSPEEEAQIRKENVSATKSSCKLLPREGMPLTIQHIVPPWTDTAKTGMGRGSLIRSLRKHSLYDTPPSAQRKCVLDLLRSLPILVCANMTGRKLGSIYRTIEEACDGCAAKVSTFHEIDQRACHTTSREAWVLSTAPKLLNGCRILHNSSDISNDTLP